MSGNAANVFKITEDKTTFEVAPTKLVSQDFYIVAYTGSNKFAALEVHCEISKSAAPFNLYPVYEDLPQ